MQNRQIKYNRFNKRLESVSKIEQKELHNAINLNWLIIIETSNYSIQINFQNNIHKIHKGSRLHANNIKMI